MKVLLEKEIGMDKNWVLVDYGDNFFGYGNKKDLNSWLGFPVNQCGTKEEVLNHCKSISNLCKQNIENYKSKYLKDCNTGWNVLIEHEEKELEILTSFLELLSK